MRKTFAVLDAVAVRDPYSLRNVREFMPNVPVRLIPDSALALPVDVDSPSPGVNALFDKLGTSPFFCFDPGPMPIDYRFGNRSSLYRLLTEMKQLVPQAVLVASATAEVPMLRQLADDTGSIYLPHQPSYRDLMAVLARTKFLISGRNHNPVLGALVGCPAISIGSTSHKVHGICELLGFDEPYDGTDLWANIGRMKAHAARHLSGGKALRDLIRSNAARLGAQTFQLGTVIRDILPARRARMVEAP
jgi:polysaccharide pyruvyl transferase WcaK-like protein